jgi:hypothetical protein
LDDLAGVAPLLTLLADPKVQAWLTTHEAKPAVPHHSDGYGGGALLVPPARCVRCLIRVLVGDGVDGDRNPRKSGEIICV